MTDIPALVSTDWLAAHLDDADMRVLDGSYHLPAAKRDAAAEFEAARIPGALRFDIDAVSDRTNALPHMLPAPEAFAEAVGALGIDNQTHVVAYDSYGLMSAARVWWMFRIFGHDRVSVLDGGFPKWTKEGRATHGGEAASVAPRRFSARFRPELVRAKAEIEANVGAPTMQVVDARAAGRFAGTVPEPRPGMRTGHIPGSRNLPYTDLLDAATGTVRPPAEIASRFAAAGIDLTKPLVASCGSGVTACVLALGAFQLGHDSVAVYDGSWSEWGRPEGPPIATGA